MTYTKSTESLPKEDTPVWVRIGGGREAEEYRIRPDDDPNEIIKFVQAITSKRVQELKRLLDKYE